MNGDSTHGALADALAGLLRPIILQAVAEAMDGATLEPLLDADRVAEILGVEVAYVHAQARAGKLPSIKVGKYRKFSPAQLKKWLDRQARSA